MSCGPASSMEGAQCASAQPVAPTPDAASDPTTEEASVPTTATAQPATAGMLDPQLVDDWTLASVQLIWDGSLGSDLSMSQAIIAKLGASAKLILNADGTFAFAGTTGNWTVIPFQAADKPLWGTGGRGPEGYARELVLSQTGQLHAQGPIDDAPPPGTEAWGVRIAFHITSPRPGTMMLLFRRQTQTGDAGVKR
jgi:hypothetical protein